MVDVWSGWTELVAIKNKASKWVREAIEKVKGRLPFDLRGIDSDTALNLLIILCVIGEKHQIKFTRGEALRSNDNCYVEQKNYSIVRQNVGYPLRYRGRSLLLEPTLCVSQALCQLFSTGYENDREKENRKQGAKEA
ncbi:hypothetical protein [Thermospira aquatica]|uniref:Calponin-homology (CH) domain-containing protein n=1 Tax=Thermospira aquatica TaxID=2828656 RepID=A0AAX3BDN1_9SPIR|nr:hypothetical protein [Thermospira aquatica]URA10331.1 hypothetical protein KDW03_00570 [Thermospira aquatica]